MTLPTVLISTWTNGLFAFANDAFHEELPDEPVRDLERDSNGDALAIVGGKSLCRRSRDGEWSTIAQSECELACCLAVGAMRYVGSEDANVMQAREDGGLERLEGFDHVSGRDRWYAGAALIDGRLVGPPLGIRSMTATCDHVALLANVHVGGIPRSIDGGVSWHPTIDIECDVHQVCAHPSRPEIVAAAAAVGLCVSRDGGTTWTVEREGLHATYCSAVAFLGDSIWVSVADDHFAPQSAVYRRSIDGGGPMQSVGGGLPRWLDGIVDTGNIAVRGNVVAVADRAGNLYMSEDAGRSWIRRGEHLPGPSSLLIY